MLAAIKQARKSIDILIFRLDRRDVPNALRAAVTRGVSVRALIAHTNRGGEKGLRKLEMDLLEGGVTVSRTADDLVRYHGKMMIVDAPRAAPLWLQFHQPGHHQEPQLRRRHREQETRCGGQPLFAADFDRQPYAAAPRAA